MKSINVPTIPLNAAIARVTRFREQLVQQVPETNIPRAILIPINDLMAIVKKYSSVDEAGNIISELQGVRAYFAVKLTDEKENNDVTALVVAVDKNGKDIIPTTEIGLGDSGDSEIYDFTVPCPSECDTESPLYIP